MEINSTLRDVFNKTFGYMILGLLITTVTAYGSAIFLGDFLFGSSISAFLLLFFMVVELVFVYKFSKGLFSLSKGKLMGLFVAYSVLNGVTFSYIPLVFNGADIGLAFISATIVFVCMAIIGFVTKADLSKFSTYFLVGLIAVIIVSLLNIFIFKSNALDMAICYVGIIIFLGLTACDIQKVKTLYYENSNNEDFLHRIALYSAFELYLDFINLFIRILQIFASDDN